MNGLLVGRFQPFHLGHLEAVRFALSKVEMLWVGLGSSNLPAGKDNPFSVEQRREMIISSVDVHTRKRICTYPIPDLNNHMQWLKTIDEIVPEFGMVFSNDPLTRHLYSRSDAVEVLAIPFLNRDVLSGTNIRHLMAHNQGWHDLVPEGTRDFILIDPSASERLRMISNYK